MYKLLIADHSEVTIDALRREFQQEFELQTCQDGETALELLHAFQPDVLVLNLMLPFKDGLTVLQESVHKPRVILALTPFVNEYVEQVAVDLGVQYIMIMPTVNALRLRLMDMIATTIAPRDDPAVQTVLLLHALNFHTHLDGYQQLCVGIPLFGKTPNMRLTKELYPAIAKHFALPDPRTVEHSIRKAITAAWVRSDPSVWAQYFPPKQGCAVSCPTNKEFISHLASCLKIQK